MKKPLKLVLAVLIFVGNTLFAMAQAVPTDEIFYEPIRNDSGDFVIVKWTTNPRATGARFTGTFIDTTRGQVILNNETFQNPVISAKNQTDSIGTTTTVSREFTITIPYGVGRQLTETTPNFRIEVTPYAANIPLSSVKPTGAILLNMKAINDYFRTKNELKTEREASSSLNSELTRSRLENTQQRTAYDTLKAEKDTLGGQLASNNASRTPRFEISEIVDVTHKSAILKVRSTSDQYVKVKAIAYLGTDTTIRNPGTKYESESKYIAPNTTEELRITNLPQNTRFFIVVQEEFTVPPNPVRTAVERIETQYKSKQLETLNIGPNVDARINFAAAAPKIINNEKIVANVNIENASSYQLILETFDNRGQPKTLYTTDQINVAQNGDLEVSLPIEKFKLVQGSEYQLKAIAQARNKDVPPSTEARSIKFSGLRDKMFNNFALGVDKDGLGFKILGVQEQSANFTLSIELEDRPPIPITCVFPNSGNERSCKLNFNGVVQLVNAFNNISPNKVNAVTFKLTAEATDGSRRKENQGITFLVDSTPPANAQENSKWQNAKSFAKKLLSPGANTDSSTFKVKDMIGNGIAGLIGLIAPFL